MLEQMRAAIRRYQMVASGDTVLASVSGGPDSVAMLHALHRLSTELGFSLHVFHMNHGLRGDDSAADAAYVEELSARLGLLCSVITLSEGELKQQPGSLQANAREARYAALAAVAQQLGARKVALGHNQDDQAETVLMRVLRGAGARGLAGIPPVRPEAGLVIIRPLLGVSRSEIDSYCRENELFPRVDESNLTRAYLRNRIRLELLPYLAAEYNPAIRENLAQLAVVMREEDAFLDTLAEGALTRCLVPGEGEALLGSVLLREPLAIARRVVRMAARLVAGPSYDLGLDGVTQVLEAAGRSEGTVQVPLPGGLTLFVEYGICRFRKERVTPLPEGPWLLTVPGVTIVPELGLEVTVSTGGTAQGPFAAAFAPELLPGPLSLRFRRPGDRIWPTGMSGSKKVQDLLTDAKVPRRLREHVPLLTAGSEVIWVIGHRLDRRYLAPPGASVALLVQVSTEAADR